jgi:hypothetical protein
MQENAMRLTPRMRTPTRLTGLSPAGPAGLLLAGLAGLLLATPTATQEAQAPRKAPPCAAPEHHQFDFWIGRWTVSNPQGQTVGSSHVSRISAGCAVLEQWQAADGPPGTSINFYEPQTGRWNQVWVGGGGMILRLVGTFHDGAMELDGTAPRQTPQGPVLDRIRWTPREDGSVEQVWLVSADDGVTWRPIFRGIYRPPR